MNTGDGIVGMVIVGGATVVTIGHQVLFVKASLRFKFCMGMFDTTLICLGTLLANPVDVVRPEEIFHSIRLVGSEARLIKPVAGKT